MPLSYTHGYIGLEFPRTSGESYIVRADIVPFLMGWLDGIEGRDTDMIEISSSS